MYSRISFIKRTLARMTPSRVTARQPISRTKNDTLLSASRKFITGDPDAPAAPVYVCCTRCDSARAYALSLLNCFSFIIEKDCGTKDYRIRMIILNAHRKALRQPDHGSGASSGVLYMLRNKSPLSMDCDSYILETVPKVLNASNNRLESIS
jgi:hypothetical protein